MSQQLQRLQSEIQRLRAENQALMKESAYREDRALDRWNRLMLRECHASRTKNQTLKQIPQEIIDQFIDHFHNDWETLRTCALVCRAWVPSSRYHLFRVVNIQALEYTHPSRYSTLIGHLDHPLCTFAPSVRMLYINASTDNGDPRPCSLSDNWLDPLIPYLSKLVSVKTLFGISIGGWINNHWHQLFKSTSFVNQITHLSLIYPDFVNFEQCTETIHSFPSLESLECTNKDPPDNLDAGGNGDDECTLTFPPPPSLRILYTCFHNTGDWRLIWHWLHQTQTRLSTIKLVSNVTTNISAARLSTLNQYVQFLGPSLEILQTNFVSASTVSLFVDHVDLTLNTGLRVLEIGFIFYFCDETQSFNGELSSFTLLLSRFPKKLTSIKFIIIPWNSSDFHLMAEATSTTAIWIAIDELLSGPLFPALTNVAFFVYCRIDNSGFEMIEYLERKMARCKGRGLLCTSIGKW